MHALRLRDWVLTAVLLALAAGFPVAVILAWLYDFTSRGVERTPSAAGPLASSRAPLPPAARRRGGGAGDRAPRARVDGTPGSTCGGRRPATRWRPDHRGGGRLRERDAGSRPRRPLRPAHHLARAVEEAARAHPKPDARSPPGDGEQGDGPDRRVDGAGRGSAGRRPGAAARLGEQARRDLRRRDAGPRPGEGRVPVHDEGADGREGRDHRPHREALRPGAPRAPGVERRSRGIRRQGRPGHHREPRGIPALLPVPGGLREPRLREVARRGQEGARDRPGHGARPRLDRLARRVQRGRVRGPGAAHPGGHGPGRRAPTQGAAPRGGARPDGSPPARERRLRFASSPTTIPRRSSSRSSPARRRPALSSRGPTSRGRSRSIRHFRGRSTSSARRT